MTESQGFLISKKLSLILFSFLFLTSIILRLNDLENVLNFLDFEPNKPNYGQIYKSDAKFWPDKVLSIYI